VATQNKPLMRRTITFVCFTLWTCLGLAHADASRFQFWEMSRFDRSTCDLQSKPGKKVLMLPTVTSHTPWDQLIVSWNADAPKSTSMEVWVRGGDLHSWTHWYCMGDWSAAGPPAVRTSRKGQKDADGQVKTDTLILKHCVSCFQVRVVMSGPVTLHFLGVSLTDSHAKPSPRAPNRQAWGRQLSVPAVSQLAVPGGEGWCSPASVSMVLAYWARQSGQPHWQRNVAQCAAGVYDKARDGTGNWSFNAAFVGALPGLKAYVTRLPDSRALEDWIAQGIPVILAVSVDLHSPADLPGPSGHLIVCTGQTAQGDLIVNDPWTHLKCGESVRRIIPRSRLAALWAKFEHTVYIIHPTTVHPWQEAIVP
jgi:hypothetical protein